MSAPASENHDSDATDTSALDLSVAFFCSVLVLFVFVAFNLDDREPLPDQDSLGQEALTVAAEPGMWGAVVPSGRFAVMTDDTLYVVNLARVAQGIVVPSEQVSTDRAWGNYSDVAGFAANQFTYRLNLNLTDPEPDLIRESIVLNGSEFACPDWPVRSDLAVFVPDGAFDLGPLLAFGATCNLALRIEPVFDPEETIASIFFGRSAASYAGERMFR